MSADNKTEMKKEMPSAEPVAAEPMQLKTPDGRTFTATINADGSVTFPPEYLQALALSESAVAEQAQQVTSAAVADTKPHVLKDDPDPGKGVKQAFTGLPMRELIGAPLFAAAEAQEKLAGIALNYFKNIAYENAPSSNEEGTTRLLKFNLNRPVVDENGQTVTHSIKVEAPFIGLVPIPSLLIDNINVDFQMEVSDTTASKSTVDSEVNSSVSSKWFGINASVSGKVSSSRENTRSTNTTGKYQVHVSASQQPQTEGLSKLMDIMASCIEPINSNSSSGGGAGQ